MAKYTCNCSLFQQAATSVKMYPIRATFDAQGFTINGQFQPAEVSLYSPEGNITLRVNQSCDYEDVSASDQKQIDHLQRKHHGLVFRHKNAILSQDNAGRLLKKFWSTITCGKNCCCTVGVKSQLAYDWIHQFDIPAVNLTGSGATWANIKDKANQLTPCCFHEPVDTGGKPVCSCVTAISLWQWLWDDEGEKEGEKEGDAWWDYPVSANSKKK